MNINSKKIDEIFLFKEYSNSGSKKDYNIIIPTDIKSKSDLMNAYKNVISPVMGYFGENWDALRDTLVRFDWLNPEIENIVILHKNVPMDKEIPDLMKYLEILAERVMDWQSIKLFKEVSNKSLIVVFPSDSKKFISSILSGKIITFEGLSGLTEVKLEK